MTDTHIEAGRIGMERVRDAVEADCPGWTTQALAAVRRFAARQSGPFTTETMRWAVQRELPITSRLRVWGPVTKAALRAGYLEPTDSFAPTHSSNGSPRRMYRRGPRAEG